MEGEPSSSGDIPQNKDPEFFGDLLSNGTYILSTYGWFILAGVCLLLYIKSSLEPKLKKMKEKREEMEYLNVDPETARKQFEARERAFNRLQEEHSAKVDKFKEEQTLKEEKKRAEKIEEWEKHQRGGGYHSKSKTCDEAQNQSEAAKPKPRTSTYRAPDYNPLVGGSSGPGYRPARRTGGG